MSNSQVMPLAGCGDIRTFRDNPIESEHEGRDWVALHAYGPVERYYFRFLSPTCEDVFADRGNFDNRANRSFLARLYWNGNATDQVAIVFNGLDETIHQFESEEQLFRFYEQLGIHLAQRGILTIVLPTPYHMNRVLAYLDVEVEKQNRKRIKDSGRRYIDFTVPSNALMQNNFNIYRNHFQGFKETLALCRCLCPEQTDGAYPGLRFPKDAISGEALDFFRSALSPGVIAIFLIGYSLGGLRALTEYVRDRHGAQVNEGRYPLFRRCVAINSGGALHTLPNPSWVQRARWKKMIEDLLSQRLVMRVEERFTGIPKQEREEAERYYSFLEDVFLGQAVSVNNLTREDAARMFFVVGGGDDLVPVESLQRLKPPGGVNILHIAGMEHLYAYDQAWDEMRALVFDLIHMFTAASRRSPTRGPSTSERFTKYIALLDHKLRILPYLSDMRDLQGVFDQAKSRLKSHEEQGQLARQVLGATLVQQAAREVEATEDMLNKRFADYTESLLNKLKFSVQRQVWHPGAYRGARRKLLLGAYLIRNNADLQDSWESSLTCKGKRIGEALLDTGVITQDRLERAVDEQGRDLNEIREQMAEDFRAYIKRVEKVG